MATFPTYPSIEGDGYAQQRASAVQRTQMESGPPKQLKTLSRVMVTRSITCLLHSNTELANFITWFQTTINYGADWFTWTDPVDSTSKNARIVGGLNTEEVFGEPLINWKVRFKLETWSA